METTGNGAGAQPPPAIREQDRLMPIANVIRIMRRVLPPHAKISDDAKETIQECVSEYISFITGEANERCQREQRKTITADDVLWAMSRLGFDDYVQPLSVYLHRFREFEGEARGAGAVVGAGGGAARGRDHHHHHAMLKSRSAPHHDILMHPAMHGGAVPPPHHAFFVPPHYGAYEMSGGEHGMAAYGSAVHAPAARNGDDGGGGSSDNGDFERHQQPPFGYKQ